MYSYEEAEAELAEKRTEIAKDTASGKIVTALPNFKTMTISMKSPSFFSNVFVSKKMNKVQDDNFDPFKDKEEDVKELVNDPTDPPNDLSNGSKLNDSSAGLGDETKSQDSYDSEEYSKDDDIVNTLDPPMPKIGKPVHIERLINRTKAASSGMTYLMDMVKNDVLNSIQEAKTIPVTPGQVDRVQVTKEISHRMNHIRKAQDITDDVTHNMGEIQKSLNYRKSGLIMMNSNYSHRMVRRIEPIYVQEARTVITFK